ncbi:MAG: small conductance mechanosensitive channel [Solirubrobacterales bacterium]|jgi:small-conductance mechanosensitive channel|nr:small conductance mechanosensitive channel [Solirubrobacterales bacterium]
MLFRKRPNPFESRTEIWRQAGLGGEVDRGQAQRARGVAAIVLALTVAVLIAFDHRRDLFPGGGSAVRIATVAALVVLGWALARTLGRGIAPALYRRLDPATAGTVGFLVRLLAILGMVIVALRVAGLDAGALAVGGAFTAVVLGLAAQQTLGNLFAGLVLLSTRPFRVGERVRLQGGALGGRVEGIASSLGLFYTTLVSGADRIMVPNSVILNIAVVPLREPEQVELRARFDASISPAELQAELREAISVPIRYPPDITLEELDRDEVVLKVAATPVAPSDGAQLASELLDAMRPEAGGDRAAA